MTVSVLLDRVKTIFQVIFQAVIQAMIQTGLEMGLFGWKGFRQKISSEKLFEKLFGQKLSSAKLSSERGGVMVEYALIVTLMAVGSMASVTLMKSRINQKYTIVADAIGGVVGP